MAAYLLTGLGLMLVSSLLLFVSERKEASSRKQRSSPSMLRDQNAVAFIGTTIAHGARAALSTAVGIAFAQIFWETLRSRSFTIRQIDALVKCGHSPFHRSALRATVSLQVFFVSCIASAMALIVIIVPGSLTVSSNFHVPSPARYRRSRTSWSQDTR